MSAVGRCGSPTVRASRTHGSCLRIGGRLRRDQGGDSQAKGPHAFCGGMVPGPTDLGGQPGSGQDLQRVGRPCPCRIRRNAIARPRERASPYALVLGRSARSAGARCWSPCPTWPRVLPGRRRPAWRIGPRQRCNSYGIGSCSPRLTRLRRDRRGLSTVAATAACWRGDARFPTAHPPPAGSPWAKHGRRYRGLLAWWRSVPHGSPAFGGIAVG